MKNIAFSGKIASGKTTLSKYLVEKHGYQCVSISTQLKDIARWWIEHSNAPITSKMLSEFAELVHNLSNGDHVLFWDLYTCLTRKILPKYDHVDFGVDKSEAHRRLLQDIGHGLRMVHENVWIDTTVRNIPQDSPTVVDDMRYVSDAEGLKKAGFILIRLDIPHEVQLERAKKLYGNVDEKIFQHFGELALDHYLFDVVLDATKPLEDLYGALDHFIA